MTSKILGAALALVLSTGFAAAEDMAFEITGDAEAGEKVFRKCRACHEVGEDAKAKAGPVLNGIVGRDAASIEGFDYSEAMAAAAADGLVWTPETLGEFLEKPKDYISGTKMSFAGLRKDEDRENVIAYLASFETEEEGS